MPVTVTATQPETAALLDTLAAVGPQALSACPGWTAQHIAAHMAGNHEEARRHAEACAAGKPLKKTRSPEEREAPLMILGFDELLAQIEREEAGLLAAVDEVLGKDPEATLDWAGRTVRVDGLPTHMRSESALHRWDLAGDDDTSWDLLADPALLAHAVTFVGDPLLARGLSAVAPGPGNLVARVRCPGAGDLFVRPADDARGPLRLLATDTGPAVIETDPAARLLLLWGRRPQPFHRWRAVVGEADAKLLQDLLAGY